MKSLVTFVFILLCVDLVLATPQTWQEPSCARRLSIVLPACQRQPLTAGIVFTGADFYRWTGFPRPAIASLRLRNAMGPILYQVEKKDQDDKPALDNAGVLEDNDRFVFSTVLSPKPTEIFLYYDGPVMTQSPAKSSVTVELQPNQLYSVIVKNGDLTVGLHGGGAADPNVNQIENHGRGSFGRFVWQGVTLAEMGGSWGFNFPRTLASAVGAPRWSQPIVLFEGPVRTAVEMHCKDFIQKKGDQETFKGNIGHTLYFWSGSPIIDFEEQVEYTASDFEGTWPYSAQIPVGKNLDEHDRLIVPLANQAYSVELKETKEHILANPWRTLYSTDNPEEGWFALQDTVEKTGLATFYEPMSAIEYRQAWVTYRPALHPFISIRTTLWNAAEVNLGFRDRALHCRSTYHRDLRYICLRDEGPEDLRRLYHLWGNPLEKAAKIGWPEARVN